MVQRNWTHIADEEFNAMDANYRADWAELRGRTKS